MGFVWGGVGQALMRSPRRTLKTSGVGLDSCQPPRLLVSVRQKATNVDVLSIPLRDSPVDSSPLLWWFCFTEQITAQQRALLDEHHPATWPTYTESVQALVVWSVSSTEPARRALAAAAMAHIAPFNPVIGEPSLRQLLDIIAFDAPIKPVIARVPLLHWLSSWGATHKGPSLACPPLQTIADAVTPSVKIPAPCRLPAQGWYTELSHRNADGSIRYLALI